MPSIRKKPSPPIQEQHLLFLKQQQEEAQRWRERQLQDRAGQAEQQLEHERQFHVKLQEELQREEVARREREREEKQEKERKVQELVGQERLKLTSPEALRGLRDLIRTRYKLDMEIWSLKGVRKPDRPIVEEKMEMADAILMEIYAVVETWEENDKIWTPQEWVLAREVKERLLAEGKRWWKNNPPWNET